MTNIKLTKKASIPFIPNRDTIKPGDWFTIGNQLYIAIEWYYNDSSIENDCLKAFNLNINQVIENLNLIGLMVKDDVVVEMDIPLRKDTITIIKDVEILY